MLWFAGVAWGGACNLWGWEISTGGNKSAEPPGCIDSPADIVGGTAIAYCQLRMFDPMVNWMCWGVISFLIVGDILAWIHFDSLPVCVFDWWLIFFLIYDHDLKMFMHRVWVRCSDKKHSKGVPKEHLIRPRDQKHSLALFIVWLPVSCDSKKKLPCVRG